MGAVVRRYEIRRRNKRKATVAKLKAKLLKANPAQTAKIVKRLQGVMLAEPLRAFMMEANRGQMKKAA